MLIFDFVNSTTSGIGKCWVSFPSVKRRRSVNRGGRSISGLHFRDTVRAVVFLPSLFLSFCSHFVNRADAPWGLARLSQDDRLNRSPTALDYQYKYDDVIVNVDAYVIGELTVSTNCQTVLLNIFQMLALTCIVFLVVRYW